ncbi:hypothetical protein IIA79_02405, partial [bacterium]|nr:hypothetical protein [bacterium]
EECGPLNDEQKKFVSQIAYSGEHLLAIVNDLLDLARIEAGQMAPFFCTSWPSSRGGSLTHPGGPPRGAGGGNH